MNKAKLTIITLLSLIFILLVIRNILPSQIDDVNPLMNCSEEELENANVFYVVPKFDNYSINESRQWCDYILSLNKTLYLHGVYHTYNEFGIDRGENYLNEGVLIFEDCFGFMPDNFKAPQLVISKDNIILVKDNGMNVDGLINQIFHKVYHCGDSGLFSNGVVRWV